MTKKELKKTIDQAIRWQIKWCDDAIKEGYNWSLEQHCEKIQGMLLIAADMKVISYKEWSVCMNIINALECMGMDKKLIYNLEYPD